MHYLFLFDLKPSKGLLKCIDFRITLILVTIIHIILPILSLIGLIMQESYHHLYFYIIAFIILLFYFSPIAIVVSACVKKRKLAYDALSIYTSFLWFIVIMDLFFTAGCLFRGNEVCFSDAEIIQIGYFIYSLFAIYVYYSFEKLYDDLMGVTRTQDIIESQNSFSAFNRI